MNRNIFIQMSKINNVKGRISYISDPARQENLYAVYETTDREFWRKLAKENQEDFTKSGSDGKCIEARELIIALPEPFQKYEPNELLMVYTDFFKEQYGVECISALHHNKARTNYHIHLIFSERKVLDEPEIKVATRSVFRNEAGKKVRTKKEILDENGKIRDGCEIIKKGEVYEEKIFDKKNIKFKSKAFLKEVKQFYSERMNEKMEEYGYKMSVYDRNSPYLPTKKIGKNNPKAKYIRANNKQRLRWNQTVSRAISAAVSTELLSAIKHSEITEPIRSAVKDKGTATDLIMRIIDRAVTTLSRFVPELLRAGLEKKMKANDEQFKSLLDYCRPALKKNLERDRGR